MAAAPVLTAAEIERRVLAFLRGEPPASREDWQRLGPAGMRLLYSVAVSEGIGAAGNRLRAAALATLGQLGGRNGIKPLMEVLAEPNLPLMVRCGAIEGLGHIGHTRAVPVLQSQAYQSDFKVRLYACAALARIGSAGAQRILEDVTLRDPHSQVRRAAKVEMGKLLRRKAKESAEKSEDAEGGATD